MLTTRVEPRGFELSSLEEARIRRQLDGLARRLARRPDPTATLVLTALPARREIEANLRVQLGPLGGHLVSRVRANTADRAARLAVEDVERQLERRQAGQRGEPAYGVPSRRLPARRRPGEAETPPSSEPVTEGAATLPPEDEG